MTQPSSPKANRSKSNNSNHHQQVLLQHDCCCFLTFGAGVAFMMFFSFPISFICFSSLVQQAFVFELSVASLRLHIEHVSLEHTFLLSLESLLCFCLDAAVLLL